MGCCSKIITAFKQYLVNCNLHGIRYIVEDGFHWTERLFWLITCALCWFGCTTMVQDSLDGFYHRPVAFTAESTYLDWKTDFPSISVCMRGHPDAFAIAGALYKKKYGSNLKTDHLLGWLFSSTVIKGNRRMTAQFADLTSDDIVQMYKDATFNCTMLMGECYWKSTLKFKCCDEFMPLKTAAGLCYTFNSRFVQTDSPFNKFTMNQKTGVGYLSIGITEYTFVGSLSTITVYINNNLAMPTATDTSEGIAISKNKVTTVYFTLEDTFNEPGLKHIPPERRGCRFSDEIENFHSYRLYSNSICLVQLQMENMLKVCGCVSHLFPYATGMPVCNYTGVLCIHANQETIMAKNDSGKWCLPDCEGTVMRYYTDMIDVPRNTSTFEISQGIHLELLALPTSRYRRYVVRSLLDLVVAIGSTAGLFMGAGILSLVEIPYWLLLHHGS